MFKVAMTGSLDYHKVGKFNLSDIRVPKLISFLLVISRIIGNYLKNKTVV